MRNKDKITPKEQRCVENYNKFVEENSKSGDLIIDIKDRFGVL